MAEVRLRRPTPGGQLDQREADIGFIFDDVTRQVVAIYGDNPTEDTFRFELDALGRTVSFVLAPGETRRVQIPARFRLTETVIQRLNPRTGLVEERTILPFERVVTERVFARPRRASPVVLSVTATEVATGTTHNMAMPATVNAGDLLLAVETWNGDGSATTNGVPSGWAEDGQIQDAPFGYIALLVKEAVGDEDGTNVNFTTSPAAPVICHVYRIEAGSWDDSSTAAAAVQIGGSANGSGTSPNPGSLSPAWGSADNLWIAVAQSTEEETFSARPSGYTDGGQNNLTGAEGELAINTAYRTNTAASEDPGAFTMTSGFWLAGTIAVKPSTGSPATVTPAAIAVPVTVPGPAVAAASLVAPGAVAAAATLPGPSLLAASLVAPDPVAAPVTVPTPSAVVAVTANPDQVDTTVTLPTPTLLAGALVEPLAIEAIAALPTPAASVGQTVTPDPVTVGIDIPTPVILAAAIVTPSPVTVTVTLPQPAAAVAALVAPAVIAVATTMPSPTVAGPAVVTPQVILVNVTIPTGSLFTGVLAIVARALGQFHRLDDRLHLAPILPGIRRGFRLSEGWERVSDPFIYDGKDGELGDHEATSRAVAAAWAAHAGSDAATLKAAIHTQLDALGYRRTDGSRLL